MANCKRRRDLKNYTQIKDRGGIGGGSDVVDGFLKQPVTREAKGQIRNVPGCFACCLAGSVYHGCRINETTHVKDATGDQEQMPCDLHATVAGAGAAAASASDSVVCSKGWAELACKLGVDSAQPGPAQEHCRRDRGGAYTTVN